MKVWEKSTQPPSELIFPRCLSDETQRETPHYNPCRSIQEDNPNSFLSLLKGHCAGVPGHNHGVQQNAVSPKYSCTQLHYLELRNFLSQTWFHWVS